MTQSKSRSKLWAGINGATGAQILTAGGTLGTGNVAFTANPTADDTITVNGTVFTFIAGASTAVDINIKGTLALTLAEAETVIEANTTVGTNVGGSGVICNVDVTNTDADLTFRFYPNATVTAFVSSTDGANTTDTGYVAGSAVYLNASKAEVLLEWADASGTLTYLTLPNGTVAGQLLEIFTVSVATSTDSVGVLGDFGGTNNLVTIGGDTSFLATEGCTLYWNGGQWNIKVENDAVASATTAAAL